MGAQSEDKDGIMYDPGAETDEGPVHGATLTPFFLSKYEMNQTQWIRLTGENPSVHTGDGWYPVNRVSWVDCMKVLGWIGCTLPTEAQWEYAVRAGTETPWWPGEEVSSLAQMGNLADAYLKGVSRSMSQVPVEMTLKDGVAFLARADRFHGNPFGLHGMIGNVTEWCVDEYTTRYSPESVFDPLSDPAGGVLVARGGSYRSLASRARSANRFPYSADYRENWLGVRPARRIAGEIQYDF
jgi:formylglycine-generating enzyme required for sulfatase activity